MRSHLPVPLAEILKHHLPKTVDLHNYSPKNAVAQKIVNWNIRNKKVLCKLNMNLTAQMIEDLAKSKAGAIEKVLFEVKSRLQKKEHKDENAGDVYMVEGLSPKDSGELKMR